MVYVLNRQRLVRLKGRFWSRFAACVLQELGMSHRDVSLVFVGDRAIRRLNREFRGQDRPTDVLSFPADPVGGDNLSYLGDLVISVETARRQAVQHRISVARELKNLIIHGLAHLCGYDHETDNGEMNRLERRLRRRLILSSGKTPLPPRRRTRHG